MSHTNMKNAFLILASVLLVVSCKSLGEADANKPLSFDAEKPKTAVPASKPNADGTIPSGTGVEKEKPEAGKANVQGKVFFNEQPAEGIEVKLCEKFTRFGSGCGGETFVAKTDSGGEYLIKGATPRIYEGLVVKVFNTPMYVFATSGYVQSAKYEIEEGKTYFAPDTHLFKQDLKLVSPKAGSKINAAGIEVKWDEYPDAAYYKLSIHADSKTGAETDLDYVNKRIDGTSYVLDKPLKAGTYTTRIDAFNANDIKLSQSSTDIKFSVAN